MKVLLALGLVFVTGGTCGADKESSEKDEDESQQTGFHVTEKGNGSGVRVLSEGGTTLFDISSKSGIGNCVIQRRTVNWPMSILVRLRLKGLESFAAANGKLAVEWSVSSTVGMPNSRVALRQGTDEQPLDANSPYHTQVRVVGGNGKIPLNEGYFEVPLPAKLFENNPEVITLRWIDFYR